MDFEFARIGEADDVGEAQKFVFAVFVFELRAFEQARRERGIEVAVQRDFVALQNVARGVNDAVRQIAVVRDQQQAFAVFVQPPDAEKLVRGVFRRNQIEDRSGVVRVEIRADAAARLVHHQNDAGTRLERNFLPVQAHVVFAGNDALAEFGDAAVHGNRALGDQFFRRAARTDFCLREEFLQSDAFFRCFHRMKKNAASLKANVPAGNANLRFPRFPLRNFRRGRAFFPRRVPAAAHMETSVSADECAENSGA